MIKKQYKKVPWLAVCLLLSAYITLGWVLSTLQAFWLVWVVVALSSLLLAAAFSASWTEIRDRFASLFSSDSKTFLIAVIAAFTSVIFISWLHVFVHALVISCAVLLVKLDMQAARFREKQVFLLISAVSLLGLASGWIANNIIPRVAIG